LLGTCAKQLGRGQSSRRLVIAGTDAKSSFVWFRAYKLKAL
jgi:hypothetical protein